MRLRGVFVAVFAIAILGSVAEAAPRSTTTKRTHLTVTDFGRRLPVQVPFYLSQIISEAASKHEVDPNLVAAVVFKESAFNPNAVSRRGAQGLMQLMPRTARAMGVQDSFDPYQNVLGGTKYLREMLDMFDGNVEMALAAYNAGPMAVKKHGPTVNDEAVEYVAKIKTYL